MACDHLRHRLHRGNEALGIVAEMPLDPDEQVAEVGLLIDRPTTTAVEAATMRTLKKRTNYTPTGIRFRPDIGTLAGFT